MINNLQRYHLVYVLSARSAYRKLLETYLRATLYEHYYCHLWWWIENSILCLGQEVSARKGRVTELCYKVVILTYRGIIIWIKPRVSSTSYNYCMLLQMSIGWFCFKAIIQQKSLDDLWEQLVKFYNYKRGEILHGISMRRLDGIQTSFVLSNIWRKKTVA